GLITCQDCQVHKPVPRNPQQKLTPITSPWPFYKWGIDIAGPFCGRAWENLDFQERLSRIMENNSGTIHSKIGARNYSRRRNKSKAGGKEQKLDGRTLLSDIGMPTLRTAEVDLVQNNEALEINLDLFEEKREQAAIREAKNKAKMEKYYNSKVRSTSFKPGDLVYRNNDASRAEHTWKLGSKWEGSYEVMEALVKGAYKL
ncbi:hypothetical protein Tco_1520578, partial [Tanacetum coccineum]